MSYHPLADMLAVAVPLRIAEYEGRGGPDASDTAWLEANRMREFASHADEMLYRPKLARDRGKPARMFNEVARALAIMAFFPGGVKFAGTHYIGKRVEVAS